MSSKYKHIISLGCNCAVASQLKTYGLRNASYPLDWTIVGGKDAFLLIENEFRDFLNPDYLKRSEKELHVIKHQLYDLQFVHDFSAEGTIEGELGAVSEKFNRRIKRFYDSLKDGVLLVRYIKDQAEYDFWERNIQEVSNKIEAYNKRNKIFFIVNLDVKLSNLHAYQVEKEANDTVARYFCHQNFKLFRELVINNLPFFSKLKALYVYLRRASRNKRRLKRRQSNYSKKS